MAYYKAQIEVLVDAENEAEACDAISEGLRPMLREFSPTPTNWIDWRYSDSASYPVSHDGTGFEYANQTP